MPSFRFHDELSSAKGIASDRDRLLIDVKALTLHCFQVIYAENLWKATVVLDV